MATLVWLGPRDDAPGLEPVLAAHDLELATVADAGMPEGPPGIRAARRARPPAR